MTTPAQLAQKALGAGAEMQYALQLLQAIGSGLSQADQEWLTKHLLTLPDYLKTKEGGRVMTSVVNCYRSYINYKGDT